PHRGLAPSPTRRSSDLPRSVAYRVRLEALELAHRGPQRRAPGRDEVADPGHLPADHVGLAASSADPDVPPRPLASVHRTLLADEDRKITRLNSSHVKIS